MNSGIVCGRHMSACASTAVAWLVAIQKKAKTPKVAPLPESIILQTVAKENTD